MSGPAHAPSFPTTIAAHCFPGDQLRVDTDDERRLRTFEQVAGTLADVHEPANLEKSFDQISRGISHVVEQGVFPAVLGGDHSIGYPTVRGLAPWIDGPIGIIHFDRHVDAQKSDLDERMHSTPWFHATNIPNAPATNLIQIGIGGWQAPRAGVKVGRERDSTIVTIGDVEREGVEKVAEIALELAWKRRQGGVSVIRHRRRRPDSYRAPAGPSPAACCRRAWCSTA